MKKRQPILNLVFIILCVIIIAPFLLIVGVSLSNEKDVLVDGYRFIPKHFDLSAYQYLFSNPSAIINAYRVTITYSVIATVLGVLLMAMFAYPLSQKELPKRKAISFMLYFTMLFSGGLVPTYILIANYLKLSNTLMVYIVTGLITPWYVFMMRTFFNDIPKEIIESALMDGANDFVIFWKFILPLSKPVLATIALFMFLAKWNDWNTALLYITDDKLVSLQYLLQKIMKNIELVRSSEFAAATNVSDIPSETVRMAMVVVVAGPALVVFPFFQKYFVKGLTVGSVKG